MYICDGNNLTIQHIPIYISLGCNNGAASSSQEKKQWLSINSERAIDVLVMLVINQVFKTFIVEMSVILVTSRIRLAMLRQFPF